jgi:DNA mismatch repair ATPase MutS
MKYENGELKIDVWELIEYLPKEKLLEFMESYACHDVIIKHVTDQILEGWTENMNCGGTGYPVPANPQHGLDWARREISKNSSELAKEEIGKLEAALLQRDEHIQKLNEENYKLRTRNTRNEYC